MDHDAIDREVGLHTSNTVLDGDPAPLPDKKGQSPLPIFSPCLLWTSGWVHQDATWHAGRPRPRRYCDGWGPSSPSLKGHSPQFSAHVRCGQTVRWAEMRLGTEVGLGPGDFVLDGDPAPPKRGTASQFFGPCLLWPNGWMDEDAT